MSHSPSILFLSAHSAFLRLSIPGHLIPVPANSASSFTCLNHLLSKDLSGSSHVAFNPLIAASMICLKWNTNHSLPSVSSFMALHLLWNRAHSFIPHKNKTFWPHQLFCKISVISSPTEWPADSWSLYPPCISTPCVWGSCSLASRLRSMYTNFKAP